MVNYHKKSPLIFLAARLTSFSKSGGGVRPIASGEILRRLVGKVLMMHLQPQLFATFGDTQVGIGTPEAVARVIHKIRHTLDSPDFNAPLYVLQVDLRNAFNTISRQEIINQTISELPQLEKCGGRFRRKLLPAHNGLLLRKE